MKPVSRYAASILLLALASTAHAVGLPDTGQDTCYNDTVADGVAASDPASIARDAGTHPRQDCRYGRDAAAAAGALTKTGAGDKGFDYSKIANNGSTLAAGAALGTNPTDWACTKDNITGLTWEVKVNDNTHLRHQGHTYDWYSTDAATNGGNAGSTGANTCNATLPGNLCNTGAFATAVNAAALCTYTDWRMPTRRELFTLVHAGTTNPSIDTTYFPNTQAASYWPGSSSATFPQNAWLIEFFNGDTYTSDKTSGYFVRLVRDGAPAAPTASNVSISGTAQAGQLLTGSYTYADANSDAEGATTFRWLRGGVAIAGATASTYTLVIADVGSAITFEVTPVATVAPTTGTPVVSAATAAVALPAGYVSQGGLTWMPVTFADTWANANAYCANTTILGQTGWRLPTSAELSSLYASGAMNGQGWTLDYTWSSAAYDGGGLGGPFRHDVLNIANGDGWYVDGDNVSGPYVTCVR